MASSAGSTANANCGVPVEVLLAAQDLANEVGYQTSLMFEVQSADGENREARRRLAASEWAAEVSNATDRRPSRPVNKDGGRAVQGRARRCRIGEGHRTSPSERAKALHRKHCRFWRSARNGRSVYDRFETGRTRPRRFSNGTHGNEATGTHCGKCGQAAPRSHYLDGRRTGCSFVPHRVGVRPFDLSVHFVRLPDEQIELAAANLMVSV